MGLLNGVSAAGHGAKTVRTAETAKLTRETAEISKKTNPLRQAANGHRTGKATRAEGSFFITTAGDEPIVVSEKINGTTRTSIATGNKAECANEARLWMDVLNFRNRLEGVNLDSLVPKKGLPYYQNGFDVASYLDERLDSIKTFQQYIGEYKKAGKELPKEFLEIQKRFDNEHVPFDEIDKLFQRLDEGLK